MKLEHEADMTVAEVAELLRRQLTDIDTVDNDSSTVGLVEGADNLQQRGLARSAGAYDAHHLAAVDMQVDALEHLQ